MAYRREAPVREYQQKLPVQESASVHFAHLQQQRIRVLPAAVSKYGAGSIAAQLRHHSAAVLHLGEPERIAQPNPHGHFLEIHFR